MRFANITVKDFLWTKLLKACAALHLNSLDASVVAMFWKNFVSIAIWHEASLEETLVLGACVWLGYSADRFIEPVSPGESIQSRFSLGRQKPACFLCIWLAVLSASIFCSFVFFHRFQNTVGFCLVALVVMNFFICAWEGKLGREIFPREIRTSLLFASSCVFWEWRLGVNSLEIWKVWMYLFLIFFFNCTIVKEYEFHGKVGGKVRTFVDQRPKLAEVFHLLIYGLAILIPVVGFGIAPNNPVLTFCGLLLVATTLFVRRMKTKESHFRILLETCFWIIPGTGIILAL